MMRRPLAIRALILPGACTEAPDLTGVEASIAPATLDAPALGRANAAIRVAPAEKRAADSAFKPDLSVGIGAKTRLIRSSTDSSLSPFARVFERRAGQCLTDYAGLALTGDILGVCGIDIAGVSS